jgi:hypothetical protein
MCFLYVSEAFVKACARQIFGHYFWALFLDMVGRALRGGCEPPRAGTYMTLAGGF